MTLGQRSRSRMTLKRHISTRMVQILPNLMQFMVKKKTAGIFLYQTPVFITLYSKVYHTIVELFIALNTYVYSII